MTQKTAWIFAVLMAVALLFGVLTANASTNVLPTKPGEVSVTKMFDAETVAASGSSTSSTIVRLADYAYGYFAVQMGISGSGTAKLEFEVSADGVTFAEPQGATDVFSGITATSGPGSDGNVYVEFDPDVFKYLRLKLTETGTASSITATVYLLIK